MRKGNKGRGKEINLKEIVPRPLVKHEIDSQERVVLLKPKFSRSILKRYLLPIMKRPCYRIHLDEVGSLAWIKIDGKKNAAEIADELYEYFGQKVEPRYQRLGTFLFILKKNKFIDF
ncbi:MAG: PqqD family protein [Candidatus Marinimicrobia bacterium]|nr:PqqD family protein [Candidatus Neomarinimicrobiota bacterium]